MAQKITWKKIDTGMGWNKYEGNSQDYGPYVIEKEDDKCYSVWWGSVEIGVVASVAEAKSVAGSHANSL